MKPRNFNPLVVTFKDGTTKNFMNEKELGKEFNLSVRELRLFFDYKNRLKNVAEIEYVENSDVQRIYYMIKELYKIKDPELRSDCENMLKDVLNRILL